MGHGILSEFSPQEDVIENFYLECKEKTPFIKAFHSPISRLIWRERLKSPKCFYLYGHEINTLENVS